MEVTVGEGDASKIFRIHRGVLCFYSGYFEKALNGSFRESAQGAVTLRTEDPAIFEDIQYWLYNRRFAQDGEVYVDNFDGIVKLWIFGDAHDMPMIQNAAIDMLHQQVLQKWQVPTIQVKHIYMNTAPGALLRRYMIDLIVNTGHAQSRLDEKSKDYYCNEALVDLLRVVWEDGRKHKFIDKAQVTKWDMCQHYVHEEGVRCANA